MSGRKKPQEYGLIFYGTPEFAVESLDRTVQANYQIKAVVTVADKPAGRGRKIMSSPVKKYAEEKGIPVLQPRNLKDEAFLHQLNELDADLQVVVAFRMLPDSVIAAAKDGTINLHASLLPQYRGAAPINHAIMQGETQTGVTTFFIDSKIDTGAIIEQDIEDIFPDDTAGSLHDRLMQRGANLVLKTIDSIRLGEARPIPQSVAAGEQSLKKAPKLFPQNCYVNFNRPVAEVYNFIRGLSPYPAARIKLRSKLDNSIPDAFLTKVKPVFSKHETAAGEIISDGKKYLRITAKEGFVDILTIKLQGKREMDIKSFLNGFKIENYILE